MTGDVIRVEGLIDLQRALKTASDGMQKQLRVVFNEAAATVISGAQRRVPSRTGAARAAFKARSGQREAVVVAGGRKAEYYPWLDFGGKVGRNNATVRPFVKTGRYLYPSLAANKESITAALGRALTGLMVEAGFEVSGAVGE